MKGAWGKTREEALQAIANGGPSYPPVWHGMCLHCESFGTQDCPLHKPAPPRSSAVGLWQPMPGTYRKE